MTSFSYFPGCSLSGTGVAYDESLKTLFQRLDIGLKELEDWNCCGATSYMAIDEGAAFVLSGRNLALARQAGGEDLLAPCAACYLVLRKTQDYIEHYPAVGQQVQKSLDAAGLPPATGVRVRHPLEVLYTEVGLNRIKKAVARKWAGGKVACYYGCQIVRPYAEADRAHDPTRMDELLAAAGIPTVKNFSLKTKCCGGSLTGTIHEVGLRLNYIILKEAVRQGASAIATACPLCQHNLDVYQREMGAVGESLDVPVFYFTQLLGWALGGEAKQLGLKRQIAGRKLVREWFQEQEVAVHA